MRHFKLGIQNSVSQRKCPRLCKGIYAKVEKDCKKMYLLELVHRDWIIMQRNTLQSFAFLQQILGQLLVNYMKISWQVWPHHLASTLEKCFSKQKAATFFPEDRLPGEIGLPIVSWVVKCAFCKNIIVISELHAPDECCCCLTGATWDEQVCKLKGANRQLNFLH